LLENVNIVQILLKALANILTIKFDYRQIDCNIKNNKVKRIFLKAKFHCYALYQEDGDNKCSATHIMEIFDKLLSIDFKY